jgi:cytochrome c-type biogenesis protein CcmH
MADASIRRRASGALAAVALALALASPAFAQAPAAASEAASAAAPVTAPRAVPTAADPVLEARMLAITGELRCLVCQNQTIADSHADLAVDLRQEVRELIKRGQTDDQIRRYMTDRYGDFVLYKPPFKPTTMVLWLGPALLLAVAVIALMVVIARRGRLADDRFEPDPDWDDDEDAPAAPGRPSDIPSRPGAPA